ncbi:2-hydroxyacid dehydrogenase [Alloyangia pacifica]|uniref:2-hydroxyacid dehydrogenase n=1 Tax=Alloyangia pacifica TaxID=311180 RepID=UPI0031E1B222
MTDVLAVGKPDQMSRAPLAELGWTHVESLDAAQGLDEDTRKGVKAIAFYGHSPFAGAQMDAFPNLGLIANFGVGYDAINVPDASARGIKVTNTPDVLNDDVADLAVAMLLDFCRDMRGAEARVRSGAWGKDGAHPLQRKMSGQKAGILGMGRIGREIADRLAAFKMEMHYHSRSEKETPGWTYHADPVSLAREVDFLVIALVGGPATEGYVSKEVIEALGPTGVLINISRGTTVDEEALIEALQKGTIEGAGLDVFLNEPNPDARFLTLENAVLQPHQASATRETRTAMGQLQRDNIAAFIAGKELLTPVN